jgi:pimeloyl-ACP methyl ester carboxylesterase
VVYLEGGRGECAVLLHGFGADKDNWTLFSKYLTRKYRVIIPDLPGFGMSTKSWDQTYDIRSQVERIHEFARAVGLSRYHIAGNSMGGLIAGRYAVRYPEEILSLGLFDPGGVVDREPSRFSVELENGINNLIVKHEQDFDRLLQFVFSRPPYMPATVRAHLGRLAAANREFLEKVFPEVRPGDLLESIMKQISARTLIVWGDADQVFPASSARVLEQGIRNAEVAIIDNCGHLPMFERPRRTADLYTRFLKSASDS